MSFWSRTARVAVSLVVLMLLMAILVELTPLGENKWMRVFFGVSALNFTLRAAIPLVLGALSGILCERSGIINIGIEGMMLAGAFAGFVAKSSTNDWPLYLSQRHRLIGGWRTDGITSRHALDPFSDGPDHIRFGDHHPGSRTHFLPF